MREGARPLFRSEAGRIRYYAAYDRALSLWPVPFEERDLPTSFGLTHVITAGAAGAPGLVLLHSAQASSTMWFRDIAALSAEYQVVAVDLILETGKSVPQRRMSTREDLTGWLVEVLDRCGLDQPDVVGASRGGWNGIALALAHPRRVRKLALLSPAQVFTPIADPGFLLATLRCSLFPSRAAIARLARKVFYQPEAIPALFLEQYGFALRYFNLMNGVSVPPSLFSATELRGLQQPCLLLIGDHDVVNPPGTLEKARGLIPHLDAEVVRDAGHILTMDQAEYVDGRILGFLSR